MALHSACWVRRDEIGEVFVHVVFHGDLDSVFGVVLIEINSNVTVAFPVRLHRVVVADGLFKVQGVSFVDSGREDKLQGSGPRRAAEVPLYILF